MEKIGLLLIDPQNDFCHPEGALYVEGAEQDMERAAEMIRRLLRKIDQVYVTLDQHHWLDVAHPTMWKGEEEQEPAPFTTITPENLEQGIWVPRVPALYERMLDYVIQLKEGGRYPLCIWPPHCLIGSEGAAMVADIDEALRMWADYQNSMVYFVAKGQDPFTEHYSAVKAEVPDKENPTTQLNMQLVQHLALENDVILVAGEAGSHCVANTIRDIIDAGPAELVEKIILLQDCMSPVLGFNDLYTEFMADMMMKGMKISRSVDIDL